MSKLRIDNRDECCGCIELRTGCLIIGYINLIVAIIGIVDAAVLAIAPGVLLSSDEFKEVLKEEGDAVITFAIIIGIILLVLFFIMVIVYLVGIHQNKRGHVKAYLVYKLILIVIYTVIFFASFANPPIKTFEFEACTELLVILLSVYFLLVIRNYYDQMNGNRQPAIYSTV